MLVLFEGPDGSGKTTLIKALKNKYFKDALICNRNKFKRWHETESNYHINVDLTESAKYDWRFFLEMHEQNFATNTFLCDRSFITQIVYQNAIDPSTKTDDSDKILEAYSKEVANVPHLVVYCKRDSLRNDNDLLMINGKEQSIIAEYNEYFKNNDVLNVIELDTESLTADACAGLIVGAIQAAQVHWVNDNKTPFKITTQ